MNGIVARLVLCAVSGFLCMPAQAGETVPSAGAEAAAVLGRLRGTFDDELARVAAVRLQTENSLRDGYRTALASMETQLRTQGQLDALLVVRAERERFELDPSVGPTNRVAGLAVLLALQRDYVSAIDRALIEEARSIVALSGQCDRALQGLQEQWTRTGAVDDARAARQQREALAVRREVTAARFVIEASSTSPVAANPPQTASTPPPVPVLASTVRARIERRFLALCAEIRKNDMERAIEFVEPALVVEHGTKRITWWIGRAFRPLRGGKDNNPDVRIDKTVVADDGKSATMSVSLERDGVRLDLPAMQWLLIDSEWYLRPPGSAPAEGAIDKPSARRWWNRRGEGG